MRSTFLLRQPSGQLTRKKIEGRRRKSLSATALWYGFVLKSRPAVAPAFPGRYQEDNPDVKSVTIRSCQFFNHLAAPPTQGGWGYGTDQYPGPGPP